MRDIKEEDGTGSWVDMMDIKRDRERERDKSR
jgi:hypothetical protein